MEKDFHFAATYVVARLAGFPHDQAEIICTSAQYVDDTVSEGTIRFKTGQQFCRISSAHEMLNPKIVLSSAERQVWVPFHFLPACLSSLTQVKHKFYEAIVCRPNSKVAQAMLQRCIDHHASSAALYRLGITAHVFADTWAHQGFAGVKSHVNRAWDIQLHNIKLSANRFSHLNRVIRAQGFRAYVSRWGYFVLAKLLSRLFPMGHGAVLHYPDWPFLKWSYINDKHQRIERDNPAAYMDAVDELFQFFRRYLAAASGGNASLATTSMTAKDRDQIQDLIQNVKDQDGDKRCAVWIEKIAAGAFSFGAAKIAYVPKGRGSWKYQALGTDRVTDHFWEVFDYSPEFVSSHWARFHQSLQTHQNEILHEILPKFGITVN